MIAREWNSGGCDHFCTLNQLQFPDDQIGDKGADRERYAKGYCILKCGLQINNCTILTFHSY
jgi:hypothetical protein